MEFTIKTVFSEFEILNRLNSLSKNVNARKYNYSHDSIAIAQETILKGDGNGMGY